MPAVLRRADPHPNQRTADKVNPERLITLFGQLEERLTATAEMMTDDDLREAFNDLSQRLEVIHHDAAILIF